MERRKTELLRTEMNMGFSMVELVIAIAILGTIGLMVMSFMGQGTRTYERSSADIDVQQDMQIMANALTERIVDSNSNLMFYDVGDTDAIKGSHDKALHIMNSGNQLLILYNEADDELYFNTSEYDESTDDYIALDDSAIERLGKNVTSFSVDTTRVESDRILEFTIGYTSKGKDYQGTYQVYLRNDVTVSSNGVPTSTSGEKITSVTVSPKYAYLSVKGSDSSFDTSSFTAAVKGIGLVQQDVSWALSNTSSLKNIKLTETVPNLASLSQGSSVDGAGVPIQMNSDAKSFKLTATSKVDTSKSGSATVLVKKVISVNVSPSQNIVLRNSRGYASVLKNSRVDFTALLDYWNLTSSEKGVRWSVEYRNYNSNNNTYSNWMSNIDQNLATFSGSSLLVKQNANDGTEFRITATSTFDNTKFGTYILGVVSNTTGYNGGIVRGADMDFKKYFYENRPNELNDNNGVAYIKSVTLTGVSDYPGDYKEFITCIDGVVYVDYDAYHDGVDPARRSSVFYESGFNLVFEIVYVDINGVEQKKTTNFRFPGVAVSKGDPTTADILMNKGSNKTLMLRTGHFNVSKASHVAAYVDGVKTTQMGNENLNMYLNCDILTAENGKSLLGSRTNAVEFAKFKLSAKSTGSKMHPTGPIPLTLCIDDWYNISQKSKGYVNYNVYIANVEGATQYIPGPDATGQYTFPGVGSRNITTVNGTTVDVTITKNSKNVYTLKYGGNTYTYDSVYKYWKSAS